jgi:hypothetical protein
MNEEKCYGIIPRDTLRAHNKRKKKMKQMEIQITTFEDEHNPFAVDKPIKENKKKSNQTSKTKKTMIHLIPSMFKNIQ